MLQNHPILLHSTARNGLAHESLAANEYFLTFEIQRTKMGTTAAKAKQSVCIYNVQDGGFNLIIRACKKNCSNPLIPVQRIIGSISNKIKKS